ncbi:salicylate hydroxylase [Microdochium nivale]|nr:salicylate hydroxylase [Microdochium nivale]
MAPFRILISGVGVAGPALALLLARSGRLDCTITIVERASTLRSTGQQIDLREQGVPIMKKMGIEAAVRARIVKEEATRIINRAGHELARVPATASGTGRQSVSSEFEIMRGDLVDVLYQATKGLENVRYVFGCTVEKLIDNNNNNDDDDNKNGSPIQVEFSDGTSAEYDLVVGADGTSSRTRRLMLGGEERDAVVRQPVGPLIAFFTIPAREGDSRDFTMCRSTRGRMIMTRRDMDDVLRVYFMIGSSVTAAAGTDAGKKALAGLEAATRTGSLQDKKAAWAAYYADAGWEAERFTKELLECSDADDLYCQRTERIVLPSGGWSGRGGRVVVVGDAACSVALSNGLGTTVAFVTAYTLAGELARHVIPVKGGGLKGPTKESLVFALAEYERKSRVLTDPAQKAMPAFLASILLPDTDKGVQYADVATKWLFPVGKWIASWIPNRKPEDEEKKYAWHNYPELESQQ